MSSIKDVARLSGVSISTVSRVLNKSCPVSEEKRERVEKAVRELGYVPNPAARSLLLRKTGVLGIVIPFATGEFFSEFLSGVDETAADRDYFLLISISRRSDVDLKLAISNLYQRVDGMVVWAPEVQAQEVRQLVEGSVPIVFVNSMTPVEGDVMIDFDNFGGMYEIASYLIEQGHHRIAFIKGPQRAADADSRYRGYQAAMEAHSVDLRPELAFQGDYTVGAGYELVPTILEHSPRPTAIMAPNDQAAIGVLRGLHEAGVAVPEEISVTGFDDVPSTRYVTPTLTTARVPVRELGQAAVETLLRRIAGDDTGAEEHLAVELVVRQSTGPPPPLAETIQHRSS